LASAAWTRDPHDPGQAWVERTGPGHRVESACFRHYAVASASWTGRAALHENQPEAHSEKLRDVPYGELPGAHQDATGPSGSGGAAGCGAVTLCGANATVSGHVGRLPQSAAADFPGGGVGECRKRVETGSARPGATPGESKRHCSPVLLGSCPPVCLRCMGSARANRSERSPDSGWKVFVGLGPLGPAVGVRLVEWEVLRRVRKKWCPFCLVAGEL
jgi:hypothetical protein